MKHLKITFYILGYLMIMYACTKDTGSVTINYQEASAIYGPLESIRNSTLNQAPQDFENPGKIYIGEKFILIGEEGKGIHVINNDDPTAPYQVSFISIPGNREYVVYDNTLYAESYYDMLKVDISKPAEAKLVARSEFAIQEKHVNEAGETLIGFSYKEKQIELDEDNDFYKEIISDQLVYLDFANNIIPNSAVPSSFAGNSNGQFGSVNRISKIDNHVYVVSKNNMIILDDNNFKNTPIVHKNFKEEMETIFPHQDNLFVGTRSSMDIYSLVSPTQPSAVFQFEHATSCDPVLPIDGVAYVTLRTGDFAECPGNTNALVILDVTDIGDAKVKEEIPMNSPYGLAIINSELYVAEGANGFKIFDIANKFKPTLVFEDREIEAYDIIADPNDATNIFIAGLNGLNQFEILDNRVLDIKSSLNY